MAAGRFSLLRSVPAAVREDLRADRRLRYLLLLATLTMGFWFWWRSPNFVTADEFGRLLRPMKAGGYFVADPTPGSFARGATQGVPQGATFYSHGLLLIPVALYVVLTGRLDEFGNFASFESRWDLWFAVPEWYWHASILTVRFANVLVAVASVYVVYRIGTAAWNRRAGFFGGLLLALTLAFVGSAHEADEDTTMVLALLLTTYLALRYVQTERSRYALWGAFTGGVTVSFKLTGGPAAFLLGAALLVVAWRETSGEFDGLARALLDRGRLIGAMLLIGIVTIYVGRPHVLIDGPGQLLFRSSWATTAYFAESSPPLAYPQLHTLFEGVGIPLGVALLVGTAWHTVRAFRGETESHLPSIVLPAMLPYVVVFSWWNDFEPHHILPAIVLGVVLLGSPVERALRADRSRIARGVTAGLVLSTALFAGVGTFGVATDPRDRATGWVDENVQEDERVLVYDASVARYGVTHDTTVERYDWVEEPGVSDQITNYTAYTEWVVGSTEREPEYIMIGGEPPLYTEPGNGVDENVTRQAEFYDRLLEGDGFGYEVAVEFGAMEPEYGYAGQLLRDGIVPTVEKRPPRILILEHPDVDDDSGEGSGD